MTTHEDLRDKAFHGEDAIQSYYEALKGDLYRATTDQERYKAASRLRGLQGWLDNLSGLIAQELPDGLPAPPK